MIKKKILLIRLDKIGDLICTLPVDQLDTLKDYEIHWVISKGLGYILDSSVDPRSYTELDKSKPQEAENKLTELIDQFKPDIAVAFYSPWWILYNLWKKRVPLRVGVKSQWASFLFLNKKLRQRRSEAIKHEADYNFELIQFALDQKVNSPTPILQLKLNTESCVLRDYKLTPQSYFVIHPGMAGSALNWTSQNYILLIHQILTQSNTDFIVITGTSIDEPWIQPLRKDFEMNERVIFLQNKLTSKDLLYVLNESKGVVAPSTGVLHLAASLGVKTVGIYSPIQVHKKIRWGARGAKVRLLQPDVKCPEKFTCRGNQCSFFNCMNLIQVENVYRSLVEV